MKYLHNISPKNGVSPEEAKNSYIIIYMGTSYFSFAIFNLRKNRFNTLKSFKFHKKSFFDNPEMEKIKINNPELNLNYYKKLLVLSTPYCTNVPSPIFDEKLKDDIFYFNFKKDYKNEVIKSDYNKALNINIIYSIETDFLDKIKNIFKPDRILHLSNILLERIFYHNKTIKFPKKMYIDIEKNILRIAVIKDSKLEFFNNFVSEKAEDCLYFVLNVSKELGIDTKTDYFYFSGFINLQSKNFKKFKDIIKHVFLLDEIKTVEYEDAFKKIPLHIYSNILSVLLCE